MSRYSRGADFERRVMAAFRAWGWVVYRSAGSHGAADLVALHNSYDPVLVQAKTDGRLKPTDRLWILEEARDSGAIPLLADRPKRGQLRLRRVMVEGFDEWP